MVLELVGKYENTRIVEWNSLRKAINERLSSFRINEDKLLGPYFLSRKIVPSDSEIKPENFINAFKNKVLMYLFDDAGKQKRSSLFAEDVDSTKYSEVCKAFETRHTVDQDIVVVITITEKRILSNRLESILRRGLWYKLTTNLSIFVHICRPICCQKVVNLKTTSGKWLKYAIFQFCDLSVGNRRTSLMAALSVSSMVSLSMP